MDAGRDATRVRRQGTVANAARRGRTFLDDWNSGERHLAYTLLAILGIILLGLVVVPVSIPEPLPEPEPSQVLGERYLRALPAAQTDRPTLREVQATYGADGGTACTGKLPAAYDMLLVKRKGGGTSFSKPALANMKVVQRVYCPDRSKGFNAYVRTRTQANARARAAALAATTPA